MSATKTEGPVRVYGNDHSPWVQSVLLGLHDKGVPHTLVTVPPLPVFLNSGILMPAAKFGDGPWLLDSERILGELGFSEVDVHERRALLRAFASGAVQRTDPPFRFWRRFSWVRDEHPSPVRRLWHQLLRPFSMLYFFTLITLARLRQPGPTDAQLAEGFSDWQRRLLPDTPFFGGDAPDTVDLQLFGIVQMYASIPGSALEVLRRDATLEPLRRWVERMQARFAGYGHLYTALDFEPKRPTIAPAPRPERVTYWAGTALVWLALPLTVPLALFYAWRVRRKGLARA